MQFSLKTGDYLQIYEWRIDLPISRWIQRNLGKLVPETLSHSDFNEARILMKQEMMEWQWHPLGHTQIISTSLDADSHARTTSLNFYRLDALPDAQPTVSKD